MVQNVVLDWIINIIGSLLYKEIYGVASTAYSYKMDYYVVKFVYNPVILKKHNRNYGQVLLTETLYFKDEHSISIK